jgi:hypothetical protein
MLKIWSLAVALASTTMLASAAFAAAQPTKGATADTKPAAGQAADRVFGKLSADGLRAFRDVHLARLAIFDGHTDQAKKFVDAAKAAIAKAKNDDAVFVKAEASLKSPAGTSQRTTAQGGGDNSSTTTTAWLPIDGALTLGEDYAATPAKAAGVAKANDQLKKGDHKQAMETLKLSGINVSFVMEVAPLDKTINGIDDADGLIWAGLYYEGNQALKGIEDAIRFDVADANGAPEQVNSGAKGDSTSGSVARSLTTPVPAASPTNK